MKLKFLWISQTLFFTSSLLIILISGCAKLGPTTLKSERSNYNLAVQKTNDEQLLLNLTRLKYRDTPFFMEVSSVASQFTLSTSANASTTLQEGINGIFGLGGSVGVTEKPTVTYSPLQGDQFIQRVLSPLPLETITLLYHSGWSIERIFRLCFQRMNNVKNAPGASGPTPQKAPKFKEFINATKYLRELQSQDVINLVFQKQNGTPQILLQITEEGKNLKPAKNFAKILNLEPGKKKYVFTFSAKQNESDQIRVVTRSLLGILFYLSQAVEAPEQDMKSGKVTRTLKSSGEVFDWKELTGEILRIRSKSSRPENTTLMVFYRDTWFYIDDSDLKSKSTFALLSQIFSLQAGKIKDNSPVLTLGVGQ
tara:strand:+ start:1166 stop:2266 length:1101 start_codon:yes stop_codon:yes gene_type:complete